MREARAGLTGNKPLSSRLWWLHHSACVPPGPGPPISLLSWYAAHCGDRREALGYRAHRTSGFDFPIH